MGAEAPIPPEMMNGRRPGGRLCGGFNFCFFMKKIFVDSPVCGARIETIWIIIASAARPLRDARGPRRPHTGCKDAGGDISFTCRKFSSSGWNLISPCQFLRQQSCTKKPKKYSPFLEFHKTELFDGIQQCFFCPPDPHVFTRGKIGCNVPEHGCKILQV